MRAQHRIGLGLVGLMLLVTLTTCQGQRPGPALTASPANATDRPPSSTPAMTPMLTASETARVAVSATPAATRTRPPSATTAPTKTPYPPLQTGGPYLAYWKTVGTEWVLTLMDADGVGRQQLTFDPASIGYDRGVRLSPTGEWVVAYSNTTEWCFQEELGAGLDRVIQLVHLPDGAVQTISPLFGPDFMEKFEAAVGTLTAADLGDSGISNVPAAVWAALACGIHSAAWSPDGRYLAFAAALDGGSSDLYVYDTKTKSITRLSDGPEQISSIQWSTDGRWILHTSTNVFGAGTEFNYHAAALDRHALVSNLDRSAVQGDGWVGPDIFLTHSAANGPGHYNLRAVDIVSLTKWTLCSGNFADWAVDYEQGLVAFSCVAVLNENDPEGLFLFDARSGTRLKISDTPMRVKFWGEDEGRFLVTDEVGTAYFLAGDGRLTPAQGFTSNQRQSPQHTYAVELTGRELRFYSAAGEPVRTVTLAVQASTLELLLWRPDEQGVFFQIGPQLYALDALAGEPRLVDSQMETEPLYNAEARWVFP